MALGGSFAAYGNSRSICRWNDSLFWRLKIVKLLVEVGRGWGGGGGLGDQNVLRAICVC